MDKLPKNLSDVLLLRELVENYSGVDRRLRKSINQTIPAIVTSEINPAIANTTILGAPLLPSM